MAAAAKLEPLVYSLNIPAAPLPLPLGYHSPNRNLLLPRYQQQQQLLQQQQQQLQQQQQQQQESLSPLQPQSQSLSQSQSPQPPLSYVNKRGPSSGPGYMPEGRISPVHIVVPSAVHQVGLARWILPKVYHAIGVGVGEGTPCNAFSYLLYPCP